MRALAIAGALFAILIPAIAGETSLGEFRDYVYPITASSPEPPAELPP